MWGYSCSPLCGNAKVNDAAADNGDGPNARADGLGQEECDLGQYNVDIAGMAASESWLYPCTTLQVEQAGHEHLESPRQRRRRGRHGHVGVVALGL